LVYLVFASALVAQETPQFTGIQRLTNREMFLQLNAPAGLDYRIEVSTNLLRWDVLTIGGKRIYLSGDTEDIPEMRALQNIDVAFVCIDVPYTMPGDKARSAVREFHPRIVYPYHYRNSDNSYPNLNAFKQQVGTDLGIEVRFRKWY